MKSVKKEACDQKIISMTASYSIPVLVEHKIFIPDAWKSLIRFIFYQKFHGNLETNFHASRTISEKLAIKNLITHCPHLVQLLSHWTL